MPRVILNGKSIEADVGDTLFAVAGSCPNICQEIASSCSGTGSCKECLVEIRDGGDGLTPLTIQESFLAHTCEIGGPRFRLACQARIARQDAAVEVETFKRRLQIVACGRAVACEAAPWIELRGGQVYCDGRPIARHGDSLYGMALDIGTTTVVMNIIDLQNGHLIAQQAFENPQKYGGSDVMHRISYDAVFPGRLCSSIISSVNQVLRTLTIDSRSVLGVTVAGNPTMRDLFFGYDVQSIGQKPYVSRTQIEMQEGKRNSTSVWKTAKELGLAIHPAAPVYGLPLISNHVGADMSAVLVALMDDMGLPATLNQSFASSEPFMVIDIGTNTEVVVGAGGRLICASCPAGPAFEGGKLSCGMAAADGAIIELHRHDSQWQFNQIGSGLPRGICGSGLVDVLAELNLSGEMDALGRFRDQAGRIAVCEQSQLYLTRRDASELAQAKAANGVGQLLLLRKLGIPASRISRYYLAGAFANKINLDHARRIGLILPIPDERIIRLGNASIEGAKAVLINRTYRDRIESLVRRIEHIELEQESDFFEQFVETTKFKPIEA